MRSILSFPFTLSVALLAACLLSALAGCEQGPSAAADRPTHEPAKEVRDLITALTPPPATSVPVIKNEWYLTRKRTLERLRKGDHELGLEALRVYREERPSLPEVRAGLLDIAAHTAPEESTPLLASLVTTFGEDLGVRRAATELLGECAPKRAVEVIEPILRDRYDGRTYPPEERMLAGWLTAEKTLALDPVPLLALVATDINRSMDVRNLAARALGDADSPQSRQALKVILVESTGNGYIRILAAQALLKILPREEFCALAKDVQSHEADEHFIDFLEDMLTKNCR